MTDTPRLSPRTEDDIRAELDRPGPAHFTRGEIRALLAELDRLRAEQEAPAADALEALVLTAAAARVAALPTANDGQLIAAYRDVVLNAITTTEA